MNSLSKQAPKSSSSTIESKVATEIIAAYSDGP